jgi:tetraprenyl-beta-curcumene synthase
MPLLRLLVAYELIWDFLDNLSERAVAAGHLDGRHLHRAIAEAIDLQAPLSDYYRKLPWREDGGYLRALVEACREGCRRLPCYPLVRDLAVREARRAHVLSVNHDPDPQRRDAALRRWVAVEFPGAQTVSWWELTGAASAPLAIHALLALAAEPSFRVEEIARVHGAYFPWICAATTMLDSYVDQPEDVASGAHSYVSHYPDPQRAVRDIRTLVLRALSGACALRDGHRHAVVAAAMIAMYLSKDTAPTPQLRAGTRSFLSAGGSLTRFLLPVLRLWRVGFSQRSA